MGRADLTGPLPSMRAIFALLVLAGCSYARPQEVALGAEPVAAVESEAAAPADTPAEPTNVEPAAPADASVPAEGGDVNRQGLFGGIEAEVAEAEGATAGGAGGAAGGEAGGAAGGAAGGVGAGAGDGAGAANANLFPGCSVYGCAFYGPALRNTNPGVVKPDPALIKLFQEVAVQNPAVRVRVGLDGTLLATDVFGQELEVTDQFGLEIGEPLDPAEQGELAQTAALTDIETRVNAFRTAELAKVGLDATGAPLPQAPGAAPFKFPAIKRNFRVITQAA